MRSQRDEIYAVIRDSGRHMSAEEIYRACLAKGLKTSVATVYRNLSLMADEKRLRRITVPGQVDYFDFTTIVHAHKFCVKCGEVTDIELEDLRPMLGERLGIEVIDYELCLRYMCEKCRKKEHTEKNI